MPDEPNIIDVIQARMDDPGYVPTGPTYGEVVPTPTEEEIRERIAKVNWMRATAQERERCAHLAEIAYRKLWLSCSRSPEIDEIRKTVGEAIAAAIRVKQD